MWRHEFKHAYQPTPAQERREAGRLEALSDGVFAIAMTLLVLGIPIHTRDQLTPRTDIVHLVLIDHWAWLSFVTYIVSFLTILVMWLNHHSLCQYIARIDRYFIIANGLLLLMMVFVNYPTALVANFVGTSGGTFAAAVYSGTMVIIALIYRALWWRAKGPLLASDVDPAEVEQITRQYRFGPLLYLAAFGLAFLNPYLSVALNAGLAIYFVFTGNITRRQVRSRPVEAPAQPAEPKP